MQWSKLQSSEGTEQPMKKTDGFLTSSDWFRLLEMHEQRNQTDRQKVTARAMNMIEVCFPDVLENNMTDVTYNKINLWTSSKIPAVSESVTRQGRRELFSIREMSKVFSMGLRQAMDWRS